MSDMPPHELALYASLGRMITKWNRIENIMRMLVVWVYDLGDKGDILTAHMGNGSLSDALNTLTAEFAPADLGEHITHFGKFANNVREWRNYYVHGVNAIGTRGTDGEAVFISQHMQARSRLILNQELITVDQINRVSDWCDAAHTYGSAIIAEVLVQNGAALSDHTPLASREKPPLPDKLRRPQLFLLDARRQQQPSGE